MKKSKKLLIAAIIVCLAVIAIPVILIHIPSIRMLIFQQVGFIPNSIDAIFYFFCAILVGIGYIFGWTYQQSSVYICIYLWPVLLGMSSLPILYNSIKNTLQKKTLGSSIHILPSLAYVSVFGWICKWIWGHYNQSTITGQFNACMNDLTVHAEKLGMSYTELNIVFYIVLFAIVVLTNCGISHLQKRHFFFLESRS